MLNKLPELPYSYDALSRSISQQVMELHHQKHHQGYVDKLNKALDGLDLPGEEEGVGAEISLEALLSELEQLPESIRQTVRNNGGGHYNHSQFWLSMSPSGGGQPTGQLAELIDGRYGSFQGFVDQFSQQAAGLFGSGWVWLQPSGEIITTANQDNPIMSGQPAPILGLDVWEHAYYLDYFNQRDRYTASWWDIVNWSEVENRLSSAII